MSKASIAPIILVLMMAFSLILPVASFADCGGGTGSVFFSEYVEGSGNSKALEIFNGYGSSLDLSNFEVRMYFNGSSSAGTTVVLSGTLAPGDVFVLADNDADAVILAAADQTSTASFFNGDDAIELIQITSQQDGSTINVTHDVIGQIGFDPGDQWGSGDTSTQNNTIRRKSSIDVGDNDGSAVFEPSVEWDGFAQDTFDGLGLHTASCTPTSITLSTLSATGFNPGILALALAAILAIGAGAFVLRRRAVL